VAGWPRDAELKRKAIERIQGIGYPGAWTSKQAIAYLLRAYPGDDEVAGLIAQELAYDGKAYRPFNISDARDELLAGFKNHPLLVGPAEAWLAKSENTRHSPLEVAVLAQIGGTAACRQALLDYLRRGEGMPAIACDATGAGTTTYTRESTAAPELQWTIGGDAATNVVGHVIVVHMSDMDGTRIACGVIN